MNEGPSTTAPRKPPRLRPSDTVAVLSPSWGGPSLHPAVYEEGLDVLRRDLGLRVKEMPHTRTPAEELYRHPEWRASDLHAAFADPEVRAVIASIGGDDSIRVLPLLDLDLLLRTPRIVMGYSDTVTLLTLLNAAGWVTFHGPSVMAGLAQARHLPTQFLDHLRAVLFRGEAVTWAPYPFYCDGYMDWDGAEPGGVRSLAPNLDGFRVLQGGETVRGRLFGGCFEVLDFLRGTRFFPAAPFFRGRVLFVETSEEKPSPVMLGRSLRSLGIAGVLTELRALLVGRSRDYSDEEKVALDRIVVDVVAGEFGRTDMPILSNLDFGHTDPQLILPLGVEVEIDPAASSVRMLEPAVLP